MTQWKHIDPLKYVEADLSAIRAGLSTMPDTSEQRRARLLHRLGRCCSVVGRAVAVFALCFAASTLALRQAPGLVPGTCAALPTSVPTDMPGLRAVVDRSISWVVPS